MGKLELLFKQIMDKLPTLEGVVDRWIFDLELLRNIFPSANVLIRQFNSSFNKCGAGDKFRIPHSDLTLHTTRFQFGSLIDGKRKKVFFFFISKSVSPVLNLPKAEMGRFWTGVVDRFNASTPKAYPVHQPASPGHQHTTTPSPRCSPRPLKRRPTTKKTPFTPSPLRQGTKRLPSPRRSPRLRKKPHAIASPVHHSTTTQLSSTPPPPRRRGTKRPPSPRRSPRLQKKKSSIIEKFEAECRTYEEMIRFAWNKKYPTQVFPGSHIALRYRVLDVTPQKPKVAVNTNDDTSLNKSTNEVVFTQADAIDYQLYKTFSQQMTKMAGSGKKCMATSLYTKSFIAGFAASHPQVVPEAIFQLIAIGRCTLVHDVVRSAGLATKFPWVNIQQFAKTSPSPSTITSWVKDLAVNQVLIAEENQQNKRVFIQTDGGHAKQEVSIMSYHNGSTIVQVCTGLCSVGGKGSNDIAKGMKKRTELFSGRDKKISGCTTDSGQGTPESLATAMEHVNLLNTDAFADSCGLHDIMSVFRNPLSTCVGTGGLDSDNAIQLLHTLYAFYVEYKGLWPDLMEKITEKKSNEPERDKLTKGNQVPEELMKAMQAPLITRWWTITVLAALFSKCSHLFITAAQLCINTTKTSEKVNVIASNFTRMCNSEWILADVHLVSGVAASWINKHMKWYQSTDPNFGKPGYLSVHRLVRYFCMIEGIHDMRDNWEHNENFDEYRKCYDKVCKETKLQKDRQRKYFFVIMETQVHKHNKRYLKDVSLLRSMFGEQKSSLVVAKFIQNNKPTEDDLREYKSVVHGCVIDLRKFHSFLETFIKPSDLVELKEKNQRYKYHFKNGHIGAIMEGIDIWGGEEDDGRKKTIRSMVLDMYSAQCSTQHNNERYINIAARMMRTGKSHTMANFFIVAASGFIDNETVEESHNTGDTLARRGRGNYRGIAKLEKMEATVDEIVQSVQKMEIDDRNEGKLNEAKEQKMRKLGTSNNLRTKQLIASASSLMSAMGEANVTNARVRMERDPVPLIFQHYLPFAKFITSNTWKITEFKEAIRKEFEARGLGNKFNEIAKRKNAIITALKTALLEDDQERLKSRIKRDLEERGVEVSSANLTKLKAALKAMLKEEGKDTSMFDVDETRVFRQISDGYDAMELYVLLQ